MQGLIRKTLILGVLLICVSKATSSPTGGDSVRANQKWLNLFNLSLLDHSDKWLKTFGLFNLSFELENLNVGDLEKYDQTLLQVLEQPSKEAGVFFMLLFICEQEGAEDLCDRSELIDDLAAQHRDNIMSFMPALAELFKGNREAEIDTVIRTMAQANHANDYIHYPPRLLHEMRAFALHEPLPKLSLEYEMNDIIGNRILNDEELKKLRDRMPEFLFFFNLTGQLAGGAPYLHTEQLIDYCGRKIKLRTECHQIADTLIKHSFDGLGTMIGIKLIRKMAETTKSIEEQMMLDEARQSFFDFISCLGSVTFPDGFYSLDLSLSFEKDQVMFLKGEIPGLIYYAQALHRANPDKRSHPEVCLAKLNGNPLVSADRYAQYIID